MTQQDKDLLLRDLCARLPYGVKVAISHFDEDGNLKGMSEPKVVDGYYDEKFTGPYCYGFSIREVKPYLRPMSSMTRKEQYECRVKRGEDLTGGVGNESDYLNSIHVDYRGLIEKGLAIEVTDENNPYK